MPHSLSRLDDAYTAQTAAVRARITAFTRARFAAGEYRDADLKRFLAQVVPVVLAARLQVAALTDAWLTARLTRMLGTPVRSTGLVEVAALRGVAAVLVYQRPFVTVRTALSNGADYPDAVEQGVKRLDDLVTSDLQLARTHQAQRVLLKAPAEITGYRRVLTGDSSCLLCVVASTQRYFVDDLLPMHPGCDCSVEPLTGRQSHVIDPDLLDKVREAGVTANDADELRRLVVTHDHGELGPVLARRGQAFTGPEDVTKPADRLPGAHTAAREQSLRAQITSYEETLAAGGGNDWMRNRLTELRAELADLGDIAA